MANPPSTKINGLTAASGKARGVAFVIKASVVSDAGRNIDRAEVEAEIKRYRTAVDEAVSELRSLESDVLDRLGPEKAAIFAAQQLMTEDPTLEETVRTQIEEDLISAEKACIAACELHAQMLIDLGDPYLAERAADLRDIGQRLVRCLSGVQSHSGARSVPDGAVIVATDLAPSDTAALDTSKVVAIVLDHGGVTSHTAILARSLGIPAVVGTQEATSVIHDSDEVLVDADKAIVVVNPDEAALSAFDCSLEVLTAERRRLEELSNLPGLTRDGRRVEIAANIGRPDEVFGVNRVGGEGVGLFRTEFLFLNRQAPPTEEEQYEAYRAVLSGLSPMPVVIRTLDIGGDKSIPYLSLPPEENPFMGVRAVRLCLKMPELFQTQLRALLRASVHGNLRIMFPMISNLGELRQAKACLETVRNELVAQGTEVSSTIQVGIMVEVPSAAIDADILATECDFFSIGTNDLVQYTLAADRGNPSVAQLSSPFFPAVLRLISRTIEEAHKNGIWVGMCGEMAGDPRAILLLVGMGIDELSMAASSIPKAKDMVRNTSVNESRQVWEHVKTLSTQEEIVQYLQSLCGSAH